MTTLSLPVRTEHSVLKPAALALGAALMALGLLTLADGAGPLAMADDSATILVWLLGHAFWVVALAGVLIATVTAVRGGRSWRSGALVAILAVAVLVPSVLAGGLVPRSCVVSAPAGGQPVSGVQPGCGSGR